MVERSSLDHVSVKSTLKETTFIENGCIIYEEERLLTENHRQVAQAIIKFRDWRATFEMAHSTVTATDIPKPFTDLIALLAHESKETLDALASRINCILQPFECNSNIDKAFLKAIKQIIKVTAYQEQYGLVATRDLLSDIPDRLTIYRWQAYDITKFPTEIKIVTNRRRKQRKLFFRMFTGAFDSLSESDKAKLLHDENVSFTGSGLDMIQRKETPISNNNDRKCIFCPFKKEKYTFIPPITNSRKRPCSSFDTLLYVGLNDSFDLKQRFLDELSPNSKRKRGLTRNKIHIDIGKVWLASTTARRSRENSEMYKVLGSLKMKLLQFNEDVRPAYYGTWSKAYSGRSVVNGRRPFAKDTLLLNYESDSEAEWDHDVDCEDIHTLEPDEDEDISLLEFTDEEDSGITIDEFDNNENEEEIKWVVPEGYLSDDEGIQDRKKSSSMFRNHKRVTSRPVKWPISANKHFPMKSVILGPSFETTEEPDNHPLSDFKIHLLVALDSDLSGYSPFNTIEEPCMLKDNNAVKLDSFDSTLLPVHIELSKSKPPMFQREIDKIVNSYKQELIDLILENKTKTMMGLVTVIKSKNMFCEYTTAQLQAMIHDVAIQEIRDTNTEYNWYLRTSSSILRS